MRVLISFVLVVLTALSCSQEEIVEKTELRLVHVFFRHGSRTPEEKDLYPNDPYNETTFYPVKYGHLTNIGKRRAYRLGQLLRQRYDKFLGRIYFPDIVKIVSTDFERTKMSALLVSAGLFKPPPSQIWDEDFPWMPIPYNYERNDIDYHLRRPDKYCPTYFKELEHVLNSEEAQSIIKEYKSTFDYITQHTGKKVKDLGDMLSVYQTLYAEDNMNLTLPEWTRSIYPEKLSYLAGQRCNFENYNDVLKRLNGGRMLSRVIQNMLLKSTDALHPKETKMFLYSGHENNVLNILAALNLFDPPHVPKYSAAAIVELHYGKQNKSFAVKVYYVRDVYAEPELQILNDCDALCPLTKFVEITRPRVPVNYTAECHSTVYLD